MNAIHEITDSVPSFHPASRASTLAALAILTLMAAMMFASAWGDALTNDEVPHIGAGYSYLRKSDYRMNPEHPPLMKDLGGFPLLLMKLNVDWQQKSWTDDPFGQWDFGQHLIFSSGGNPETIARAAKMPMIMFTLALGWLIFWWTRNEFGGECALLALFFYAFSPTVLAHGRLVTTDVGAAGGFFVATIGLLRFLRNPVRRNLILAGLAMGFALLTKFSVFALIPIALFLAVVWVLSHEKTAARPLVAFRKRARNISVITFTPNSMWRYLARTAGVIGMAFLVVYAVYAHHTLKYPAARQKQDAEFTLSLYEVAPLQKRMILAGFNHRTLRPFAEYALGLVANSARSAKGSSPYFLGKIYSAGVPLYFPFVYLIKEPLPLHLLTMVALGFLVFQISRRNARTSWREWLAAHFIEFAMLTVIVVYWAAAIHSHLNIGVRHLLPSLPFIYVLVAARVSALYRELLQHPRSIRVLRTTVGVLLIWQAASVLRVHPSYLPYFNELAGGPAGGWRYVGDSNVDWGQDLKRLCLVPLVDAKGIQQIKFDYFGSLDPAYYLKAKYQPLSSCAAPTKGWIAVSAMWYTDSRRKPECDYRRWLPENKIAGKIGYSIFLFHLE